ncbi:MAG: hypothetical protein D6705_01525 [Deltaproteobacteria bacterium]|nr:MAG: hypothetical protein D6705_01525 [Deltaproteobacteria bacterium]
MTEPAADDVVRFAERVLFLLGRAATTTTYKYAVLLGLVDVCIEQVAEDGAAPDVITTRQLAEKVTWLYFRHAERFAEGRVLRQNRRGQARILQEIVSYREARGMPGWHRARREDPEGFARLVDEVEWYLIRNPLPRLQLVGGRSIDLLYRIGWGPEETSEAPRRSDVRAYQRGEASAFDNRILLFPGVGEALVRLAGILRPVVERQWASMVARINDLPEADLERFLFAPARETAAAVRGPLWDLQEGRCFYCGGDLRRRTCQIDHFIPFARHPDDGIANLVLAHGRCNGAKRDFLAARRHVERWRMRTWDAGGRPTKALAYVAREAGRELDLDLAPATLATARAIYLHLPPGIHLWRGPSRDAFEVFEEDHREAFARVLVS